MYWSLCLSLAPRRALCMFARWKRGERAYHREDTMLYRKLIGAIALAALAMPLGDAQAFDDAMYPNLKGQWNRRIIRGLGGQPSFDQTKPWGFGQEAPLTPEYKAIMEASLADQAKGGQANFTDGSRRLA